VLEDHSFDDVGYILTLVGRRLQGLIDLLPFDDVARLQSPSNRRAMATRVMRSATVLQAVDLHAAVVDVVLTAKQA